MQREEAAMVHEGKNVKRIREMLGVKQEALAMDLGITQQAVSQLEQKEALDKELLEKIAEVLKVPVEAIKNFDEQTAVQIIASNNYGKDQSSAVNFQCTFNPLEKYIEQVEENKKLYEALLKSEREKIALLEEMLGRRK